MKAPLSRRSFFLRLPACPSLHLPSKSILPPFVARSAFESLGSDPTTVRQLSPSRSLMKTTPTNWGDHRILYRDRTRSMVLASSFDRGTGVQPVVRTQPESCRASLRPTDGPWQAARATQDNHATFGSGMLKSRICFEKFRRHRAFTKSRSPFPNVLDQLAGLMKKMDHHEAIGCPSSLT